MATKFTLKEIAHQAGLSLATVDRVVHGRDHVRAVTRDRVRAAELELEQQYAASMLSTSRVTIDVVIQAPSRFSSAVRAAFEAEFPLMRPTMFRARFHLAEVMEEREIVALLRRIARRGTQGIVLKAPATLGVEACLADLAAQRIPVVTYVTDVLASLRLAYVGMPNARAGATAAYLLGRMAPPGAARVLVTLSSLDFEGESARRTGFIDHLVKTAPHLETITVSGGFGIDRATGSLIQQALADFPNIRCVYSVGGGNAAILAAFAQAGRTIDVFAAHDLDRTNKALLASRQISFVIHHNFRQDARRVSLHFSKYYRLIGQDTQIEEAEIGIACPIVLP
ncbi:LacI family DNA-binding transcriptional regulator [Pseudorhodobacter wandonensis]|uniref:LacI family DNA-binding transcriptional regulator n=1 Tax=Pseudorhodobacter wandonensis TaxID=1120568 RepID=UPI00067D56F6|nr:LacI family DNA-binding transcriptional regulator [Pseudorhodobacter wandonensis]